MIESTFPDNRIDVGLSYIPEIKRTVLFGGQTGQMFNDVWLFNHETGNWTKLNLDISSSPRTGEGFIYNNLTKEFILASGNYKQDSWKMDFQTIDINQPILNSPPELEFENGTTGKIINWIAEDADPTNFTIALNGSVFDI